MPDRRMFNTGGGMMPDIVACCSMMPLPGPAAVELTMVAPPAAESSLFESQTKYFNMS